MRIGFLTDRQWKAGVPISKGRAPLERNGCQGDEQEVREKHEPTALSLPHTMAEEPQNPSRTVRENIAERTEPAGHEHLQHFNGVRATKARDQYHEHRRCACDLAVLKVA